VHNINFLRYSTHKKLKFNIGFTSDFTTDVSPDFINTNCVKSYKKSGFIYSIELMTVGERKKVIFVFLEVEQVGLKYSKNIGQKQKSARSRKPEFYAPNQICYSIRVFGIPAPFQRTIQQNKR